MCMPIIGIIMAILQSAKDFAVKSYTTVSNFIKPHIPQLPRYLMWAAVAWAALVTVAVLARAIGILTGLASTMLSWLLPNSLKSWLDAKQGYAQAAAPTSVSTESATQTAQAEEHDLAELDTDEEDDCDSELSAPCSRRSSQAGIPTSPNSTAVAEHVAATVPVSRRQPRVDVEDNRGYHAHRTHRPHHSEQAAERPNDWRKKLVVRRGPPAQQAQQQTQVRRPQLTERQAYEQHMAAERLRQQLHHSGQMISAQPGHPGHVPPQMQPQPPRGMHWGRHPQESRQDTHLRHEVNEELHLARREQRRMQRRLGHRR